MADNLTYFVTGANRGIGRALVAELVLRPSTTVVATVRNPADETAKSLSSLPAGSGSRLVVFPLDEEKSDINHKSIVPRLAEAGVAHLDVVIANAATTGSYQAAIDTNPEDTLRRLNINAIGPLRLFQGTWPLLSKSDASDPRKKKFALISSLLGSIGFLDNYSVNGADYGMTKAAANYLVRKIGMEHKEDFLKVVIFNPGLVKTDMGEEFMEKTRWGGPPATTPAECARLLVIQIDNLTLETSGKFLSPDGTSIPW